MSHMSLDVDLDERLGNWLEVLAWEGTGIGGAVRYESICELRDVARRAVVEHIQVVWLGATSPDAVEES
jgi:hypothetical protein